MIKGDIDLPDGWVEKSASEHQRSALTEYHYENGSQATFVVSILEHPMESGYNLHLSTITPISQVRHDYPIDEYETAGAAVSAAESFIKLITTRLSNGEIDSVNPNIDEVQQTLHRFNGSIYWTVWRTIRDALR